MRNVRTFQMTTYVNSPPSPVRNSVKQTVLINQITVSTYLRTVGRFLSKRTLQHLVAYREAVNTYPSKWGSRNGAYHQKPSVSSLA